jgi:hypothetical protein
VSKTGPALPRKQYGDLRNHQKIICNEILERLYNLWSSLCLVDESFARLLKTLMGLQNGAEWQDPVEELKKGLWAYVEFGLRNPSDYRFPTVVCVSA